mmetsp:Transcript_8870/g.32744  ORF Transcript_8870/g.32744 Transcript_8870/m.32744 type:complete len:899 (-) Transcript_8870:93-2789(-)
MNLSPSNTARQQQQQPQQHLSVKIPSSTSLGGGTAPVASSTSSSLKRTTSSNTQPSSLPPPSTVASSLQQQHKQSQQEVDLQMEQMSKCVWNVSHKAKGTVQAGRWCHSCGYYNGHLLVFGGMTSGNSPSDEVYLYDIKNAQWKKVQLSTCDKFPDHSTAHTFTIFEEYDEAFLLGGSSTPFSEIFVLNLREWKWEKRKTLSRHKVYIKDDLLVNSRLIEDHKISTAASSSTSTTTARTPTPNPSPSQLSPNSDPSSISTPTAGPLHTQDESSSPHSVGQSPEPFMGTHSVEIMDTGFGTSSQKAKINDRIHVVTKTVFPSPRSQHSAVRYNNSIIVFGGAGPRSEELKFDDLWIFDRDANEWEKPKTMGRKPERRWGHDAVRIGDNMFMFGGVIKSGLTGAQHMTNELFRYHIPTRYWTQIELPPESPIPAPRAAHTLSTYGDKLIILWGGDNSKYLNDMCIIDTSTLQSRRLIFSTPGPRCSHTSVTVNNFLFVFGGCDMQTGHPRVYRELYAVSLKATLQKVNMTVHPAKLRHNSAGDKVAEKSATSGAPSQRPPVKCLRRTPSPDAQAFMNVRSEMKVDNEETKIEEKKDIQASLTRNKNRDHNAPQNSAHHIEAQLYMNMQAKAITNWLVSLGLGRYAANFIMHEIEMDVLHTLSEDDLFKLGVEKMGPRKKIMFAAQKLRTPEPPQQARHMHQEFSRSVLDAMNHNTNNLIAVTANLNKTVDMLHATFARLMMPPPHRQHHSVAPPAPVNGHAPSGVYPPPSGYTNHSAHLGSSGGPPPAPPLQARPFGNGGTRRRRALRTPPTQQRNGTSGTPRDHPHHHAPTGGGSAHARDMTHHRNGAQPHHHEASVRTKPHGSNGQISAEEIDDIVNSIPGIDGLSWYEATERDSDLS